MNKLRVLGTAYPRPKGYNNFAFSSGRCAVYDVNGVAPTLVSSGGGAINRVCL